MTVVQIVQAVDQQFVLSRKVDLLSEYLSMVCQRLAILEQIVHNGVLLMVRGRCVYDCVEEFSQLLV